MAIESNEDSSADIIWPGYVDAVTNLVLNLLFMLTIMIVAVFMFALELSRHKEDAVSELAAQTEEPLPSPTTLEQKDQEIRLLQKKIEMLEQQRPTPSNEARINQQVVTASTPIPKSEKELQQLTPRGGGIIVQFVQDAVTLSSPEAETLKSKLNAIAASGGARIEVLVPAGFSEARRLGFYRAMAVRNQLIEMRVPASKIEVSIREGGARADNSRVQVSPR